MKIVQDFLFLCINAVVDKNNTERDPFLLVPIKFVWNWPLISQIVQRSNYWQFLHTTGPAVPAALQDTDGLQSLKADIPQLPFRLVCIWSKTASTVMETL